MAMVDSNGSRGQQPDRLTTGRGRDLLSPEIVRNGCRRSGTLGGRPGATALPAGRAALLGERVQRERRYRGAPSPALLPLALRGAAVAVAVAGVSDIAAATLAGGEQVGVALPRGRRRRRR